MICIEPSGPAPTLTTSEILSIIDRHASTTALIVLPGIQYYTGQYFDIKTITAHAHSKGLLIGWDLAHAVGNVELCLHEWEVDFAVWCTYKYVNSGPGAIAGLFVHERHGKVSSEAANNGEQTYRPRLSGWWGGDKQIRFEMGSSMYIGLLQESFGMLYTDRHQLSLLFQAPQDIKSVILLPLLSLRYKPHSRYLRKHP